MSVVDAIGWIAALSSALLAVPQGARIVATRSVAGVSTVTWQTMLVAGLAWTCHGLLHATPQIIWPNALLAVTSAWVLWQLCRARALPLPRTWIVPIAVATIAVGADLALGPVAFAAVIFVPGATGQVAQLREIVRAPDSFGVSMAGLVMNLANQVLWFGYALPADEVAVMCVSVPMGILVSVTIAMLALRRAHAAAPPSPAVAT